MTKAEPDKTSACSPGSELGCLGATLRSAGSGALDAAGVDLVLAAHLHQFQALSGRRLPAHAFLEMTVDEKGWSGVLRDRFRSLDLVRCAGPVPSGVPCRLGEGVSPFAAAEGQ